MVFEKLQLKPFVMKCIWLENYFKIPYNDPHTKISITRSCTVFLLRRELTRSAILWSQNCDSTKWTTVFLCDVKGKPGNFEACLCGSLYSIFTTSFYPYAFYNKRLQTLFKDQLARSKATCSFKAHF